MNFRKAGVEVRDLLMIIVGTAFLVVVLTFVIDRTYVHPRTSTRSTSSSRDMTGTILLTENGTGTDVFLLDVPEWCFGQDLNYVANRRDTSRPASIKFVVMQGDEEVRVTGPKNVERTGDTSGVGVWSLEDDRRYTLTVYGDNAEWMALIRCR